MSNGSLQILDRTPAELGYTFPPEWHPHAATWFSWPRPEGVSFPGKYQTVPENVARIIKEIVPREQVHINVPDEAWQQLVRVKLTQFGCPLTNVFFHNIKTNETWCRDHGPAFVVKGNQAAIVDWKFNEWGGKYPRCEDDDAVPAKIAEELNLPLFQPNIVMEGGSVDFNGAGTVMTTTNCLLNKNRNPQLTKPQIEQYLKDFYGQKHVIWLSGELPGDDTDGHIDDLARFIGPRKIVVGIEEDPKDFIHQSLVETRSLLRTLKDQDGQPFEIVELPMPGVVQHNNVRLPATYMNFYFINGAVLVPTYRHATNDRRAIEILQQHLPEHKVIGVDCVELIWGRGAIHCITQQQPLW